MKALRLEELFPVSMEKKISGVKHFAVMGGYKINSRMPQFKFVRVAHFQVMSVLYKAVAKN